MRIRITFQKTEAMRFTGHLDLHRAWERTFRRASLPLAYSQGFHPGPRLTLACALPLGFTSECEVVDAWLEEIIPVEQVWSALIRALPPGLRLAKVIEVDPHAPSLQTQVWASEYEIQILQPIENLDLRIDHLLSAQTLPRERRGKPYDLRPLIEGLKHQPDEAPSIARLDVVLATREGATGRPEEVVRALNLDPRYARIHRKRLIFKEN